MSRAEVNRAAACYHIFTALVLLLCGGGLLGLGIWLESTSYGGALDLSDGSNTFLDFILRAGILCIVIGAFILVTAVCALIALGRRCVGKTFRIIYIILAILVLVLVAFIAVVSWMLFARRNTPAVREFFKKAWEDTVKRSPKAVCAIQNKLNCLGFMDSSCRTEKCVNCKFQESFVRPNTSCYSKIRRSLRNVYLPTAIVSTVLAVFVLVDIFVVCAL